ncbi:MAG: heparinase II/III family protein [Chloroflexi bacterium]|nr:heparinase II/III family protein [Chloroflexota bacterium]MCY3938887.1 heparinase II/III family protein [Chloroflexota bacterium]
MLLFSEEARDALRLRGGQPEFSAAVTSLAGRVMGTARRRMSVPDRRAGYYHDYFCPDHAKQFEFDPESPDVHRCPIDGRSFGGEKLDAAWRWFVNNRLSTLAFESAVLGVATGVGEHLEAAWAILTQYARKYSNYEPDPDWHFSGRACYHALDEAVWLINLAWACDLVLGGGSRRDAGYVRTSLLEPAADWIAGRRRRRIHNIECWLNAALVTAGAVCGRDDLVETAIDGPYRLREQVSRGVLKDGLWYEGSLSYHFYTLAALMWTSRALEAARPDLARFPEVERMLLAAIDLATADGSLPSINDCWSPIDLTDRCGHAIPEPPGFYETGWSWYRHREFAAVLQRAYRLRPRDSIWLLLEGQRTLPAGGLVRKRRSAVFENSGLALLRDGSFQLLLKYGRHGGVHGHYDKLGLSVYGEDAVLSPDLGTPGFGVGLSDRWYAHTASHNTVMVDGNLQPAGWGSLLRFETTGGFELVDAAVGWTMRPHAGVRFRRAVLIRQPYFIDLFSVSAPVPRRFDWIYHNEGSFDARGELVATGRAEGVAPHPELSGWTRIRDASALQWRVGGDAGMTVFPLSRGGELYSAEGPSNPASESRTAIVRRMRASRGLFIAVFCPWRGGCPVDGVELEHVAEGHVGRLTVDVDGGRDVWDLGSFEGHTDLDVSLRRA